MPPATMLDLPRELYLDITDYLNPKQTSTLARLSKDHYLAVQEPLYAHVSINAWPKLVILVRTLMKPPIVSSLSAKQRLNWHKLSDQQLRERSIKTLEIALKSSVTKNATGSDLARMVGAISRGIPGVKIHLQLQGAWYTMLRQLQNLSLPDVVHLTMHLGYSTSEPNWRHGETEINLWDMCFGGSVLPDLRQIEVDTKHASPETRPTTLAEACTFRPGRYPSVLNRDGCDTLYGLEKMESISLNYNHLLTSSVLESLFDSNIIPQNLTRVNITNCPSLHQSLDIAALSMLLHRGLRLLQHLKLHVQPHRSDTDDAKKTYCSEINENPHRHLCNVVREAGQQIKYLDLALPFACKNIFLPIPQSKRDRVEPRKHPHVPYAPPGTLPDRLIAEGYRHRRLIVWDGICRESHDWREMKQAADDQGERVSWEMVGSAENCASWHIDGCLPLEYPSDDVLERELTRSER
ncbi:hypothetical protein AC578_884 [Pseudocercospora eumusae]|uniref:F-box domain-containing protein n=1 Tax=Pseudocercospora eumusae TaxID=321146 RepID=A0A139H425_9PEZI|nr:hypothetical protein AC578_884 [Pseudocercospora eumusae]